MEKVKETDENGRYMTVSIPVPLVNEVDRFIGEHPELGYKRRAEFIKEAVRNHLRLSQRTL